MGKRITQADRIAAARAEHERKMRARQQQMDRDAMAQRAERPGVATVEVETHHGEFREVRTVRVHAVDVETVADVLMSGAYAPPTREAAERAAADILATLATGAEEAGYGWSWVRITHDPAVSVAEVAEAYGVEAIDGVASIPTSVEGATVEVSDVDMPRGLRILARHDVDGGPCAEDNGEGVGGASPVLTMGDVRRYVDDMRAHAERHVAGCVHLDNIAADRLARDLGHMDVAHVREGLTITVPRTPEHVAGPEIVATVRDGGTYVVAVGAETLRTTLARVAVDAITDALDGEAL